mmetsp:Transcript_18921/g.39384  ORF Transcript_18921/g.39384 Transcript_18921/m.39384 type:complete len:157 (-) Transcript_18921:101-571(-)
MQRLVVAVLLVANAHGWILNTLPKATPISRISPLNMFSGAGTGGESDEVAEANAKAYGMSLKEYQLAMRMREQMANALNNFRATGKSGDVEVVYDGNVKLQSCTISSVDSGKEQLEGDILKAWEQALEGAAKEGQAQFMKMQSDIQKEMPAKGMGM